MTDQNDKQHNAGRRWLTQQSERLDGAMRSQLNQARQQALTELPKRRQRIAWLPLAGASTAALLIALLFVNTGDIGTPTQPELATATPVDDFELLLAVDNLEMIEELEFFELLNEVEVESLNAG